MSIFGAQPGDGEVKWAYQMTPHDEWDYDGVNENILFDKGGQKLLAHFDRNGFGYTLDRTNGKVHRRQALRPDQLGQERRPRRLAVPSKDPTKAPPRRGTPRASARPRSASRISSRAAYSPNTGLFYVPTNNICMDYEGVEVKYTAGQPYVGAIVRMFPGPGGNRGRFIAWDPTATARGQCGRSRRTWRRTAAR